MAYITGNQYDFENRLHQFANSTADLDSFAAEGNNYYNNLHWSAITKLNKEFQKIYYEITGTPTQVNYIKWTPAAIEDLLVCLQFTEGNCYESNGGAATVDGLPVGYVSPLFGSSISATAVEIEKPTLRADGLDMGTNGSTKLVLSSELPGDGEFTVYWSVMVKSTGVINFLCHSTAATLLGGGGSGLGIYDTNTNSSEVAWDANRIPSILLGRYDTDALNGNFTSSATYGTDNVGSGSFQDYPFDQIGGLGGVGMPTDQSSTRLRLLIYVNRHIALNSPEDILIRNWIKENDGAELGTPWSPADILNLTTYLQFIYGWCQIASGDALTNIGGMVGVVNGLYGTALNVSELTNKPTLQADGLQLDAAGVQQLIISTLSNTSDITVYWSMIVANGASLPVLNSDGLSFIGSLNDISIWDNNGSSASHPNNNPDEIVMGRFSLENSTEAFSFIATGSTEVTGTIGTPNYTFSKIGGVGGLVSNDNVNNRIRLIIWINRIIVLNSEEDLLIRNWIETFDGATL